MILKGNGYELKCRQKINNLNCVMDIRQTYNVKYVFIFRTIIYHDKTTENES